MQNLHGATSQKASFFRVTAVKTSDLTLSKYVIGRDVAGCHFYFPVRLSSCCLPTCMAFQACSFSVRLKRFPLDLLFLFFRSGFNTKCGHCTLQVFEFCCLELGIQFRAVETEGEVTSQGLLCTNLSAVHTVPT
jgi:hypothetical protein